MSLNFTPAFLHRFKDLEPMLSTRSQHGASNEIHENLRYIPVRNSPTEFERFVLILAFDIVSTKLIMQRESIILMQLATFLALLSLLFIYLLLDSKR